MRDYTRAELKAIGLGWSMLADLAERLPDRDGPTLADALKRERRGRYSATIAKGLLCQCFADESADGRTVADLHALSPGCQFATICGAYYRRTYPTQWAEIADKVRAASEAFTGPRRDATAARRAAD